MSDVIQAADIDLAEKVRAKRSLPSPGACRALRLVAGATQADVAEAVGVHRETVARWENGSRHPTGQRIVQYVTAPTNLNLTFPSALTFDGLTPTYNAPSSNPFDDLGPPSLQRESVSQYRTLTNYGARSDLTWVKGIHNVKAGITYEQTALGENDKGSAHRTCDQLANGLETRQLVSWPDVRRRWWPRFAPGFLIGPSSSLSI